MIRKIENVTAQNMFDDAVRHLLTQRKRATGGRGNCRYRATGGLRCPIGARIPDAEYAPDFENMSISAITTRPKSMLAARQKRLRAAARVPSELCDLARSIQHIHDYVDVSKWPDELRRLAKNYKLLAALLDTPAMQKKARLCAQVES